MDAGRSPHCKLAVVNRGLLSGACGERRTRTVDCGESERERARERESESESDKESAASTSGAPAFRTPPGQAKTRSSRTASWAVEGGKGAFAQFRVLSTGKSSGSTDHLMCAGIELYGVFTRV
jgi:hypothetical protein